MTETEYRRLDQVQHMLENPERDLGSCVVEMVNRYLLDMDGMKLSKMEIPYSTAVEQLYKEILYNAADNVERSRKEGIDPGIIQVWMTKDTIRIRNEGRPISCMIQPNTYTAENPNGVYIPEFIFSNLLTGSNFGGVSRKVQTVGGRFGIGCKATNIFSTFFKVDIGNAKEGIQYSQTWKNNMSVRADPVINRSYKGTSYTQVTFVVDFSRFYDDDTQFGFAGRREYTPTMLMTYAKHCADVSVTANVRVFFNTKEIDCTTRADVAENAITSTSIPLDPISDKDMGIYKYAQLYFPPTYQLDTIHNVWDSYFIFKTVDSICIILDTPCAGTTISFVNGVINEEGGIHVDSWRKILLKPIIQHLKNKVKGIAMTEKHVVEHISMFLICRLNNPKYKSQTKDKVTSPKPTVSLVNINGEDISSQFITSIAQWESVKHLEQLMKAQLNTMARKLNGSKKKSVDSEKLMDAGEAGGPHSQHATLIITEGDGAANFAVKGIEDGGYTGALPIKGKLLNVGTCDIKQYTENGEIKELHKALGLITGADYSTDEARKQLRYGRLVIMTDQDKDGAHIRMLIINFFRWKYPSLLKPTISGESPSFVQIMETPYMRVKDGRTILSFFYEKDYFDWINDMSKPEEERVRRSRITPQYYKGLGSSSDTELLEAFRIGKIMIPKWDEKAEDLMAIAFDEGNEDERKKWLLSWDPIQRVGTFAQQFEPDSISHLVTNQLCEFSHVNVQRSIPSIVDGLKECQRKVLTVVMGREMASKKKVSQLKGLVSDKMHYRYGDEALYRTIVGMGNYCVGTNNIPLIKAHGQYDSRLGKKAAPDRYIFAARSPLLPYIFRKEDECILEYLYDGKDKIEPKYYYPIVPIWAINGSLGIGTGFSTKIPAHDPVNVIKRIAYWLKIRTGQVTSNPGGKVIKIRNSIPNPEDKTVITSSTKIEDTDTSIRNVPYEAPPELIPWYRNYQGKIVKSGNDWYSVGSYSIVPSNKRIKDILVSEIPVTQTIKTYMEKLKKLKEKPIMKNWTHTDVKGQITKCPPWITSFKPMPKNMVYTYKGEKYIEVLPNIIIEGALCATAVEGGPIRALGLIEKISDTNITLLDIDSKPHQYGGLKTFISDEKGDQAYILNGMTNALDTYCQIRYDAYVKRREKQLEDCRTRIKELQLRKSYIMDVANRKISLYTEDNKLRKKADIIKDITSLGYPSEFGDISIFTITEEGIEKLDQEIAKFQQHFDRYEKLSPAAIWMAELEILYNHL